MSHDNSSREENTMQMPRIRSLTAGGLLLLLGACGGGQVVPPPSSAPGNEAAAPIAGPPSNTFTAGTSGGTPAASRAKELDQRLRELEASGAIVKLDRSDSLLGPDENHNGVRDDIEAWINSQPVTDKQRRALMQDARVMQSLLQVDLTNEVELQKAGDRISGASKCLFESFHNTMVAYAYSRKSEAFTANTHKRALQYARYNSARGGSVTVMAKTDTCEP